MITKRSNSKNYFSEFVLDGVRYVKSTRTTDKKLATKIDLEYYKQAVEQAKLGGKTITLKEALQLHLDHSRENPAYQSSVTSVINWLNSHFDTSLPMTRVDNKFLFDFVNQRGRESKPSTVKHNLGVITRTIKLCKRLGYDVCEVDPPKVRVKNTKTRVLTADEEQRLLDSFLVTKGKGVTAWSRHHLREWHDITVCLLGTGCRINEILELKWSQVDMTNKVLNIWRKKTSTASVLPMSNRVFDLLSQRSKTSDYVFPNDDLSGPRSYSSQVFKHACQRAGIEEVTWHTLRHHRITEYAKSGLSIPQIMTLSGHASFASLQKYSHLTSADVVEKARSILNN